ncbi:MAG: single-stranded DNA-binding protein [Culicoidibacterales bacterium]
MLNQVVLIGRIANAPEIRQTTTGKAVTNIALAVPRAYKNVHGTYDTDFVQCTLWEGIAKSTVDHCEKGELIAIKGRLQTRHYEDKEGKRIYVTEVITERVTFITQKGNGELKQTQELKADAFEFLED